MKVTYGPIVQRASGRFGGVVHSNWKGVDVVRRFAKPSNPSTSGQSSTRHFFQNLTISFTLMSTEVRAAWDSFAGGKPFLARNAYLGKNIYPAPQATDLSGLKATPGDASTIPLVSFSAVGGVGTITPTITAPAAPTGWTLTGVVCAACFDYDFTNGPSVNGPAPWHEQIDLAAPYNTPITGLPAGTYRAFAFIKWLAPDGSVRYSASSVDASPNVVT